MKLDELSRDECLNEAVFWTNEAQRRQRGNDIEGALRATRYAADYLDRASRARTGGPAISYEGSRMNDATRIANTLAGMHTGGWEGRAGDWDPRRVRQRPSLDDRLRTLRDASDYTRRTVGRFAGVSNVTPELWAEALRVLEARIEPRQPGEN